MKNKSLKIFLISMIFVFVVFTTKCMAVNIDMDLGSNLVNQNVLSNSEMIDQIENVENTMSNSSSNTSSNSESAGNVQASNQIGENVDSSTKTNNNSSVFSTLPESELGLTNVLNILLIAVGFVLILLAIAIIIKLIPFFSLF